MNRMYYIYIVTNKNNTVLYTGVTNNLSKRIREHKEKKGGSDSFTRKYNVDKLVYFEEYNEVKDALVREKQIKAGSRKKKIDLVNKNNHSWKDLYNEIWNF